MRNKHVLILSASIGSGHERAAKAIAKGIRSEYPDAAIDIVDFMSAELSYLNALLKSCYLNILAIVPDLYGIMYSMTSGSRKGGFVNWLMAKSMAGTMKKVITQYRPDVIICTHPFPADAISHLSKDWRSSFMSIGVITDYSIHPVWICPNLDEFCVAVDSMKAELIKRGIRGESIHVTGIPVSMEFYKKMDKAAIKAGLNLDDKSPVVLMMGGGLGLGGMAYAMSQLERIEGSIQLLVIAGKNTELQHRAEAKAAISRHRVQVFGYTKQVRSLMEASDLLISKPGALTLTEAVTVGLPMLLHEPIPGPETDNAIYMSGCGAAGWVHSDDKLAETVDKILFNSDILNEMKLKSRKICRPHCVQDIVAILAKQMEKEAID